MTTYTEKAAPPAPDHPLGGSADRSGRRGGDLRAVPAPADLTRLRSGGHGAARNQCGAHYYEKRIRRFSSASTRWAASGLFTVGQRALAFAAASAARAFQPTKSRAEAQAALAKLIDYFGVLASAAPAPVDIRSPRKPNWTGGRQGARMSGRIVTASRWRGSPPALWDRRRRHPRSGIMRAEAMAFRDSHGDDMRKPIGTQSTPA